jgi:hypothetical protein
MAANDLGIYGLPHCWVCEQRFTDVVPPGRLNREEHHIVPRQAGGTDGPQVSLCDGHHMKAHKIAGRFTASKPFHDLLSTEPTSYHPKLLWLAKKIHDAFELVRDDPNKRKFAMVSLDQRRVKMIDNLKRVYPKAKSREAVLTLALEQLYQRHFTED